MMPNREVVSGGRRVLSVWVSRERTISLNIPESDFPRSAAWAFAFSTTPSSILKVSFACMTYNFIKNIRHGKWLSIRAHFFDRCAPSKRPQLAQDLGDRRMNLDWFRMSLHPFGDVPPELGLERNSFSFRERVLEWRHV